MLLQRPGNLRGMGTFAGTGIKHRSHRSLGSLGSLGTFGKGKSMPHPTPAPTTWGAPKISSRIRRLQKKADKLQDKIGDIRTVAHTKARKRYGDFLLHTAKITKTYNQADVEAKRDLILFIQNIMEQIDILAKAPPQVIAAAASAAGAAAAATTAEGGAPQPASAVLQADQAAAVRELTRMIPATTAEAQVEVTGAGGRTRKELLTSPGQVKWTPSTTKVGAGKVPTHFERLMKDVPKDFNEAKYIAKHPDVAKAVKLGVMPSGLWHYVKHGKKEGRAYAGWFGGFGSFGSLGGFIGSNTMLLLVGAGACWYYCSRKKR